MGSSNRNAVSLTSATWSGKTQTGSSRILRSAERGMYLFNIYSGTNRAYKTVDRGILVSRIEVIFHIAENEVHVKKTQRIWKRWIVLRGQLAEFSFGWKAFAEPIHRQSQSAQSKWSSNNQAILWF